MSKLIFTFGRFNPPTIGHAKVFDYILDNAYYSDADHLVAVSKTHAKDKNPLDIETKLKYLKLFFPQINFEAATKECPDFISFLKKLNDKYEEVVFIAGEDRLAEYTRIVNTYNGREFNYKRIDVISAGARKGCDHGVCGASSTKMREYAKEDRFEAFFQICPTDHREHALALFYEVRHGLGLKSQEFSFYK